MAASYPSSVKTFTNPNTGDVIAASHVAELNDEVNAIEDALLIGIDHDFIVADTGPHVIGGATLDYVRLRLMGSFTSGGGSNNADLFRVEGAMTGASGDTEQINGARFVGTVTTQGATETITTISQVRIDEPDITVGSGDTVTNSASLYIAAAATEATNDYALWVDAGDTRLDGNLNVQGVGPHAIGGATLDYVRLHAIGSFTSGGASNNADLFRVAGVLTGAAGDTEQLNGSRFVGSVTTQGATETITTISQVTIDEPNITVGAGDTVTNSATLYIASAATEATNDYALWVDAGETRFDENVGIGVTAFGGSAVGTLAIANGTQGSALANAIQLVSEDLSAGNTILSIRTEGSGAVATGTPAAADGAIAIKVNGTVRYLTYSDTAPT